jgi:mxaK protein
MIAWSRLCLVAGAALLLAGTGLAASGGLQLWRMHMQAVGIARLAAGQDVAVGPTDAPTLQAAKARALIAQGNFADAQAIADRLALSGDGALNADLLYALGNANLRRALKLYPNLAYRQVRPFLALARSDYRQALHLDPQNWDARYNLAIAAALLPETEHATPASGDEMAHERAAWPDIPGTPNGMP